MIVVTDLGPIRLTTPAPAQRELSTNERAWITILREIGGGTIPPPKLAVVQAVRHTIRAQHRHCPLDP